MTGLSSDDDESAGQEDTEHSLTVNVGPNSVFLFDYALVTTTGGNSTNTTAATQGVNSAYVYFIQSFSHFFPFSSFFCSFFFHPTTNDKWRFGHNALNFHRYPKLKEHDNTQDKERSSITSHKRLRF